MPGMTGWEVARTIKTLGPTTPVVLVTGWDDEPKASASAAGCVDRTITKPLDLDEVSAAVARALAGRTA